MGVGVGVVAGVVETVVVVVGGGLPIALLLLMLVLGFAFSAGARASSIIVVAMVERASGGWPVRYKRNRFKRFKFLAAPNVKGVCPPAVGVAVAEPGAGAGAGGRERLGKRNVKAARNPPIVPIAGAAATYQPLRIRGT